MPYIGNTIRAADDYRLIDDISSSFNGSTTSFALQVAGSAPVPFPKSPQQVLISVNGVIQEPDPTGASGFNLVGTNIVFSSAPTNGHAFFGIIYATADYLNAGGNFPAGALGSPSITFIGDENTGLYRKGSGSVGFVSDATEIANFDSNGITISSGNFILGDSSGANDDRIKLGASGDLEIYHDASHSRIVDGGTGGLKIQSDALAIDNAAGTETMAAFTQDGSVQLRHNNSTKFETTSAGATVTGTLTATSFSGPATQVSLAAQSSDTDCFPVFALNSTGNQALFTKSNRFAFNSATGALSCTSFVGDGSSLTGINTDLVSDTSPQLGGNLDTNSHEIFLDDSHAVVFGDSNDLRILHDGTDNVITSDGGQSIRLVNHLSGGNESMIKCIPNGSTELYHNGTKKIETSSSGVTITGDANWNDNGKAEFGNAADLQIYHDGTTNLILTGGPNLKVGTTGETFALFRNNNAVELYYDNTKRVSTTGDGAEVAGAKLSLEDSSGSIISFDESGTRKAFIGIRSFAAHNGDGIMIQTSEAAPIKFAVNNAVKAQLNSSGHFLPGANNASDLGSTSLRWANLYINDLQLSNKGSSNDVDQTWGDYTIQEGFEDLFLINHRTGKKFKFNLTEVA